MNIPTPEEKAELEKKIREFRTDHCGDEDPFTLETGVVKGTTGFAYALIKVRDQDIRLVIFDGDHGNEVLDVQDELTRFLREERPVYAV